MIRKKRDKKARDLGSLSQLSELVPSGRGSHQIVDSSDYSSTEGIV